MTWHFGLGLWLFIGGVCAQVEYARSQRHPDEYLVLAPTQRVASTIAFVLAWPLWVYIVVQVWREKGDR